MSITLHTMHLPGEHTLTHLAHGGARRSICGVYGHNSGRPPSASDLDRYACKRCLHIAGPDTMDALREAARARAEERERLYLREQEWKARGWSPSYARAAIRDWRLARAMGVAREALGMTRVEWVTRATAKLN